MKKSFVIIKSFIITHLFILLLPLSLLSQTPLIEPSWELMPGDGPIDKDNFLPLDIMEFNDGCYLVPVSMEKAIKFVKIDNDGGILQETVLQYDENSIGYEDAGKCCRRNKRAACDGLQYADSHRLFFYAENPFAVIINMTL